MTEKLDSPGDLVREIQDEVAFIKSKKLGTLLKIWLADCRKRRRIESLQRKVYVVLREIDNVKETIARHTQKEHNGKRYSENLASQLIKDKDEFYQILHGYEKLARELNLYEVIKWYKPKEEAESRQ